jgi:AcrR family transcriptional regulator
MPRTSTEGHGDRRRHQILAVAIDVASAEGLEGLSIARLATEVGMSKSGLFAHFGSKQDLQLATLREAAGAFQRKVLAPTLALEPGVARLRTLVGAWVRYVEQSEYRGGCFFAAASSEFTGRAGPVRELLAELTGGWVAALEREARTAQRLRELPADLDPSALAFRLHALCRKRTGPASCSVTPAPSTRRAARSTRPSRRHLLLARRDAEADSHEHPHAAPHDLDRRAVSRPLECDARARDRRPGRPRGSALVSAADRWRRIGRSWLGMKPWVKAWLFLLNGIFLAALLFRRDPLATVALAAYVASGPLLLAMMWRQGGLTRLLGVAHLVPWLPLLAYLELRLTSDLVGPRIQSDSDPSLFGYALALYASLFSCLALDTWDVLRWRRGERFVLGTREAHAAGASARTID